MQDELFSQEMTVSELTGLIKKTLVGAFYGLRVSGEISNFRPSSTGHWFFALKDQDAVISVVMFKGKLWKVGFSPKDGDKVTITGSIDVYEKRGSYQIVCESMEKSGQGDILVMLEERKRKYAALGYFDESAKKPIPLFPKKVGVVTSPTGAALQDILNVLRRRAPSLDVVILPASVQGEDAAPTIAQRIEEANILSLCDLLIVARGGGSLEDLLPFSEECVIEAIHKSEIPVISGVGHEIDWSICDYVADLRAPTPSAAAELASKGYQELRNQIGDLKDTLVSRMEMLLSNYQSNLALLGKKQLASLLENKVAATEYRLANTSDSLVHAETMMLEDRVHSVEIGKMRLASLSPVHLLETNGQELSGIRKNLVFAMQTMLDAYGTETKNRKSHLDALNPLSILERGYSVVTDGKGKAVFSASSLQNGDMVDIRFADGKLKAEVKE